MFTTDHTDVPSTSWNKQQSVAVWQAAISSRIIHTQEQQKQWLRHLDQCCCRLTNIDNVHLSNSWQQSCTRTTIGSVRQWGRSVIEYGRGQGQSGQAIKLSQITPYVNDFQTLNNSDSWQPVGASKNWFYLPFFDWNLPSLTMWKNLQSYPTTVMNERMWHFRGSKHTLTPHTHFEGIKTPTPRIYTLLPISNRETKLSSPVEGQNSNVESIWEGRSDCGTFGAVSMWVGSTWSFPYRLHSWRDWQLC